MVVSLPELDIPVGSSDQRQVLRGALVASPHTVSRCLGCSSQSSEAYTLRSPLRKATSVQTLKLGATLVVSPRGKGSSNQGSLPSASGASSR